MSTVLDYINTNNLSLLTWLNADSENLVVTPTSFTWKNKKLDTLYDFIQIVPANFPVISPAGITFTSDTFLRSRSNLAVTSKSYTFIHISKNVTGDTASLLSYSTSGSLTSEVTYSLTSLIVNQKYSPSLLTTSTTLGTAIVDSDVMRLGVVHDVKHGRSSLVRPDGVEGNIINIDTSHIAPSSKLQLGGQGTLVNLYHFLIFDQELSASTIQSLMDLLLYSTPALNDFIYWDLITTDSWGLLNEAAWNNII